MLRGGLQLEQWVTWMRGGGLTHLENTSPVVYSTEAIRSHPHIAVAGSALYARRITRQHVTQRTFPRSKMHRARLVVRSTYTRHRDLYWWTGKHRHAPQLTPAPPSAPVPAGPACAPRSSHSCPGL